MRIAHVVSTFSPHTGGMGVVCYNEAKLLSGNGHDVTVFTLKYPGTAYDDTKFAFKVARLKPLIRLGDAGLAPQISSALKGFDLVHLHYPFYGGAEWLGFGQIPLVITYHMDAQLSGLKAVIAKAYDWFWPKILFARAKKIIAVDAEHFKNTKFGKGLSGKTVEIPNGVDADIFRPRAADLGKLGLAGLKDKKIILFVGNPLPLKRLDLLLNAVKLLPDRDWALVVVGGGYRLNKYKQMAGDLGIADSVYFAGQCDDRQKLSDYYNAAACVAVPSDYESFSLVAAEAMACGIPVIAGNIPGMAGRINPGVDGLLFEKGSADSLTASLERALALSGEERKKMGERGREKVVKLYNWPEHALKLEALYKEILTKN